MASKLTDEQQRIAADLKKGTAGLPPKQYVHVYAGDVAQVVAALEAETTRADAAEAKLPKAESVAEPDPERS